VTENVQYRKCRPFQVGILLSGSALFNFLLYECVCIVAGKPIMAMFQTPFLDECFAKVVQSLKAQRAESRPSLRVHFLYGGAPEADIQIGWVPPWRL
jgi:hypothetical protein